MSDAPIIEAKGLSLWYGPNHALKDISVAVPAQPAPRPCLRKDFP